MLVSKMVTYASWSVKTPDCCMWMQSLHVADLPCAFDWVLTWAYNSLEGTMLMSSKLSLKRSITGKNSTAVAATRVLYTLHFHQKVVILYISSSQSTLRHCWEVAIWHILGVEIFLIHCGQWAIVIHSFKMKDFTCLCAQAQVFFSSLQWM